jgi:hypothetical protein
MNTRFNSIICFVISGLVWACSGWNSLAATAADHAAVLAPYVNDDTFAALYADIGALKNGKASVQLSELLPKLVGDAESWTLGTMIADGLINRFQLAGGQTVYLVAGLEDVHIGGGPLVLATARAGQRPEETEKLFRDVMRKLSPAAQVPKGAGDWQLDVLRKGDVVLLGAKSTVGRYAALKASARPDVVEPLTKLAAEGAVAAAVFCPGPDFRRVVRELWPELPGALAPFRGELADQWLHLEIAVNLPPSVRPRVALQAKDSESAELFARWWRDLPTAVTQFGGNENSRQLAKGYAQRLVDSLPAKVEGTRAVVELPTDENQIAKLRSMLAEAIDKSMESSRRKQRMNQFKQLALAIHNYADVNKHLPPAAICDKNGQPLLSWRVAVLPFIEEGDLYSQFHLDEPWDSPHNRSLIARMPELFADPDPKLKQLAKSGKTTYQVPVGPETIFFNNEGGKFKEITDGTANTIMIVEVDPAHAVEWTKPADWEVDLENPRRGVGRADRSHFAAAFADGHVEIITPQRADDKLLRAQLTRAGGEPMDRP